MKRGKFIVLEGLDRSGKSSAVKTLKDFFIKRGEETILMNFPDRSTQIGAMISSYLRETSVLSNEAVHLLFSANRWERMYLMEETLKRGVNIICDRYWFSGVAYSCAKGMDYQWCVASDRGLIQPDLIVFLNADPDVLKGRKGYGEEIYEKIDFQKKVKDAFCKIFRTESNLNVRNLQIGVLSLQQVQKSAQRLILDWLAQYRQK